MGAISRLLSGCPKCSMCRQDATGYVGGSPYCTKHKRQMRTIGGPKVDRRQR